MAKKTSKKEVLLAEQKGTKIPGSNNFSEQVKQPKQEVPTKIQEEVKKTAEIECGFAVFLKDDGTYGFQPVGKTPDIFTMTGLLKYAEQELSMAMDKITKGPMTRMLPTPSK